MNKITDTACPNCGDEHPLLKDNESNNEEYLICFACGHQKLYILKMTELGVATMPNEYEFVTITNYGGVTIEYEKPRADQPNGLCFVNKEDYNLFKSSATAINKKEAKVKRMVFGRFEDGKLIKEEL